ncbi:MAG: YiiD C-terminal domain-containing protein [Gammaproteobacteria bacterium]
MGKTKNVAELEDVLARIPLARAMEIRVASYTADGLHLVAPAAPNINHIGIAFGGAIECLGTLAGWGLLWLALDEPNLRIVIQYAETTFKSPLQDDLHAVAALPESSDWKRFREQLQRRGRARINLTAHIGDPTHPEGANFHGRYAVTSQTITDDLR